jgi:hypothetical protein
MANDDFHEVLSQGIVFKRGKDEDAVPTEHKLSLSTYMKGAHKGSGSAKMKAGFKLKRALRSKRKNKSKK